MADDEHVDEGSSIAGDPPTEEMEAATASGGPVLVFGGAAGTAADYGPDDPALDPDEEWPARATARGIRMRTPTLVLVALLVAAGAFWGGAAVQRSHGTGSTGLAGLASRFALAGAGTGSSTSKTGTGTSGARTGAGGFAGFGGASTAAATGTVTVVDGSTLYVTSTTGSIVKVEVAPSTTITRDAKATSTDLRPGDTVVVEGSKAKDGTVTATSVAATAAGVTATAAGGFGGAARDVGAAGGATGSGG